MKYFLFLVLFCCSISTFSQPKKKLKGKPATLDATFLYLNEMLDEEAKYSFMTLPEDVSTSSLHRGLGRWIRNNWGLGRNSKLKRFFIAKGIGDPEIISSIILQSYHRYLNHKPIDLEGQVARYKYIYNSAVKQGNSFYYSESFYKEPTSDSVLIGYFQLGDTIRICVNATEHTLFNNYATCVDARAIVKEQRKSNLLVQVISIKDEPKKIPQRRIGDNFEIYLSYCWLLPPKGWKYTMDGK